MQKKSSFIAILLMFGALLIFPPVSESAPYKIRVTVVNTSSYVVDVFVNDKNTKKVTLPIGKAAEIEVEIKGNNIVIFFVIRKDNKMTATYRYRDAPCSKTFILIKDKDF